MILYELVCAEDHRFEAWFRDSRAYDEQAAAGIVECPVCGSVEVRKAIMAPRLAKGATAPRAEAEVPRPPAPAAEGGAVMAGGAGLEQVRQLMGELRRAVETHCEDVGSRFAEEARAIHYGEAEERPIYGEATAEEAEALNDEGIAFHPLPFGRKTDA